MYLPNLWCLVQGFEKLQELVDKWEGPPQSLARYNLKLFADKETYEAVDELAKIQDKNAHQLAMEIIRNYVSSQQNGKSEWAMDHFFVSFLTPEAKNLLCSSAVTFR